GNNRAVNFPLAWQGYVSAVVEAPKLAVADPLADLRTLGLWQAYTERGDGSFNRYGDVASAVRINNGTPGPGLDMYAQVTGDPALAAFAQHARKYRSTLYHNEYGWMYPIGYDPYQPKPPGYNPSNPGASLAGALPDAMVFGRDAFGLAVIRQGWSTGDTQISFKAGDYLTHHEHTDQGTFTIFKYDKLVINSGGYGGGYTGVHRLNYYVRTVSTNSILIQRPGEVWDPRGVDPPGGYVNDGGQRLINSTGSVMPSYEYWLANKTAGKQYETGDITAFDNVDGDYSYVGSDITRAYNSTAYDSNGEGGKVSQVTRQVVYLHDEDAMIVFDRVASTNPGYKKKWLLHTPNKFVGGSEVVALGSANNGIVEVSGTSIAGDTMTMTNGNGKLFLQVLRPATYTVNKVGGTSYRYYVEDDGDDSDGYDGTNHDGYTETSWHDYGNWRIEISPESASTFDTFLNVLTPRHKNASSVTSGEVLADDAVATVMRLGQRVLVFGTHGTIDEEISYALGEGGAFDHLILDSPPGRFWRIGNTVSILGFFANDAGVLAFAESAAGARTVTLTPLPDPIAGDVTLDGRVNITDLGALASNWQSSNASWTGGDFNGDGLVNITDLGALASNW
ncbi:hypothetical protein LCGC14_2212450, partial [marine sediment metagenome]